MSYQRFLESYDGSLPLAAFMLATIKINARSIAAYPPSVTEIHVAAREIAERCGPTYIVPCRDALATMVRALGYKVMED